MLVILPSLLRFTLRSTLAQSSIHSFLFQLIDFIRKTPLQSFRAAFRCRRNSLCHRIVHVRAEQIFLEKIFYHHMCYNFLTRARERSGAGPANQRRRRSKTMSPERGWTLVQRRVVRPRINEHRKALTPPNPEETSFWSQLQGKIRQTPSYDYDRNQQTNQRMNRLPYTPPPIKLPPRKHDNYENKNKKYHVVRKKDNMVSPSEFWNDHYQKIKDNDHPRTGHKRWLNNNRKNQQSKGKGKKNRR